MYYYIQHMKRDTIFYQLFQRSPTMLFQLLKITPDYAEQYRFDSVSVKEPTAVKKLGLQKNTN